MKPKAIVVYLALAASALIAAPSALGAQTVTIGSTAPAAGANPERCEGHLTWQSASASMTPFAVPAGGTQILAWQTHMSEVAEAGAAATLVVLRPEGEEEYAVVGTDTETLPEAVPADETASFALTTPIAVQAGDVLGLYSESTNVVCAYWSGETPGGDTAMWKLFASAPLAGEVFGSERAYDPEAVNVAATVALRPLDVGVSTSVAPTNAVTGQIVSLTSLVTNYDSVGTDSEVTVTDAVPAGLTISAAAIGGGVCHLEGQSVICTVARLAPGASAPLLIAAEPGAAGAYVNKVSVVAARSDPNPGNDHAEATLTVAANGAGTQTPAAAIPACEVPRLRTVALAAAKQALRALHCKLGHVRKQSSGSVRKGAVLSTSPGPGSYAAGRSVAIVVSTGRAAHRNSSGAKHKAKHVRAKHKAKRSGAKRKADHAGTGHKAKHNGAKQARDKRKAAASERRRQRER